ncbi:MAG: DUF2267 domain-containing protein [Chitinivibrionales bacterium]|nr:DUF2267 domain-containing protein [Chitinivibrionales bacterium]
MAMTGLDTFDTTVQKSEIWLKEIMKKTGWKDRQKAYKALRAVLHALRDRLTVDEGAHLSSQLPMLTRGIFYESWRPAEIPVKFRTKEAFLQRVRNEIGNDPSIDPEIAAHAVIAVMNSEISSGEAQEIRELLPVDLRQLWHQ